MKLSAIDMYALLAATRLYLDRPPVSGSPGLAPEEEMALITARTILRMASDGLAPVPRSRANAAGAASVHEADVELAPAEARVLARAAAACLEAGLLLAGLNVARAKLIAAADD
jgi:hypothetical protein